MGGLNPPVPPHFSSWRKPNMTQFVVPVLRSTPLPHGRLFDLNPPTKSGNLLVYLHLTHWKFWLLGPPSLRISNFPPSGGYRYFLEPHINLVRVPHCKQIIYTFPPRIFIEIRVQLISAQNSVFGWKGSINFYTKSTHHFGQGFLKTLTSWNKLKIRSKDISL